MLPTVGSSISRCRRATHLLSQILGSLPLLSTSQSTARSTITKQRRQLNITRHLTWLGKRKRIKKLKCLQSRWKKPCSWHLKTMTLLWRRKDRCQSSMKSQKSVLKSRQLQSRSITTSRFCMWATCCLIGWRGRHADSMSLLQCRVSTILLFCTVLLIISASRANLTSIGSA